LPILLPYSANCETTKLPFYFVLAKRSFLLGTLDPSMDLLDNIKVILDILQ